MYHREWHFSIVVGFQNASENELHGSGKLVIWLWESHGNISKSAIGQHLITKPECAKTYSDDNFRIIGQTRSSFHLGVLESVYIETQNPVLCRQKEFVFSLALFK